MQKSYIDLGFDSGLYLNKVINPVITLDHFGHYYVSFSLEEECKSLETPKTEGIGIDLGCRQTFTLSSGEIFNQPKEKLNKIDNRIRKLDQQITRDQKRRYAISRRTRTKYEDVPKSRRQIIRELKKNKLLRKKHNIKDTFYHTVLKQLVLRNPEYVCMETFSVIDIVEQAPYLASQIAQVSFYDILRKMKDKCDMYNIPFIQAPRDFASTQICNNCGYKQDMDGKHTYKCPICGMVEDRDINAAINLMNYGSFVIYE
jgi:putative transposase